MTEVRKSLQRDFAIWITQKLSDAGHVAYFAGGCVRDQLLGIPPSDYDVATDAGPLRIRDIFGSSRTLMIGESFGVVCIQGKKEFPEQRVEVATFRSDATYSDGRHPDYVTFTDAEHDAQRRDFTINGLFYDPQQDRVIDYVGGQEDLKNKILRCIGDPDARFNEDKLRILRAVRFAARFSLELDRTTYDAMCRHAREIARVSPERIAAELRKMFILPKRAWAADLLAKSQQLSVFLPQLSAVIHQPAWLKTLERIENLSPPYFESTLAALLLPLTSSGAMEANSQSISEYLATRLRLSRDEIDGTLFAIHHAQTLANALEHRWSVIQPLLISKYTARALSLAQAFEREGEGTTGSTAWCEAQCQLPIEQLNPAPLLTGNDLQRLGMSPGPRFKEILSELRAKQLDGFLSNSEQAIEWLNTQQDR
jgi:tRNA nucleotidyltransferase/poly(A) polymerase